MPGQLGKDWSAGNASAYVRTHLASHAAAAGMIDELAIDPFFLVCAEPSRLSRGLWRTLSRDARAWADIYDQTAHLLAPLSHRESASYLQLSAYMQGRGEMARRVDDLPLNLPWRTVWAQASLDVSHKVITRDSQSANSVALGMAGSSVIATAHRHNDAALGRYFW